MIILENVADPLVAKSRLLAATKGVEIRAIDVDAAFFRMLESGESIEQRRLASAARAAEENLLAAVDVEVDAMQHFDGFPPDPVAAVEVYCFNHHVAHGRSLGAGLAARKPRSAACSAAVPADGSSAPCGAEGVSGG